MDYSVKIEKGLENNLDAIVIRQKVFMDEQGFIDEFDDIDNDAIHLVVYDQITPIATARMYTAENENTYKIGRVAVLKQYRGKNIGKMMMNILEKEGKRIGVKKMELSSQERAKEFYINLGYEQEGGVYMDENCPHVKMVKQLSK